MRESDAERKSNGNDVVRRRERRRRTLTHLGVNEGNVDEAEARGKYV